MEKSKTGFTFPFSRSVIMGANQAAEFLYGSLHSSPEHGYICRKSLFTFSSGLAFPERHL